MENLDKKISLSKNLSLVPRAGIEPATRRFSVYCSTDWAIWANWWTFRDSNPGPAGYEPDALTNWAKGPNNEYYTIMKRKCQDFFKIYSDKDYKGSPCELPLNVLLNFILKIIMF